MWVSCLYSPTKFNSVWWNDKKVSGLNSLEVLWGKTGISSLQYLKYQLVSKSLPRESYMMEGMNSAWPIRIIQPIKYFEKY